MEADVPLSFFLFVSASFSSPLLSFFPSLSLSPSLSSFLPFSLSPSFKCPSGSGLSAGGGLGRMKVIRGEQVRLWL